MALTKTTENDRIEVVRKWNVEVRTATVIKEDGNEISRTLHRHALNPGSLDASDNLIETDIIDQIQIVTKYLNTSQLVIGFMLDDKKRDLLD